MLLFSKSKEDSKGTKMYGFGVYISATIKWERNRTEHWRPKCKAYQKDSVGHNIFLGIFSQLIVINY